MNGLVELDSGGGQHFDEFDAARADVANPIEHESTSGRVDQVDDVVHGAAEFVNVLTIKRRDEGLVELAEDLVGDFVAIVFDSLDALDLFWNAGVVFEHLDEGLGPGHDIFGLLLEQNEKIPVMRHEPLQKSRHGAMLPPEGQGAVVTWEVYRSGDGEARYGK